MNTSKIVMSALAGMVAVGLGAASSSVLAAKEGMEKCTGIVKAAKNDCGTAKHACAGQSSKDNQPEDWIYLPTGACAKITGGEVKK